LPNIEEQPAAGLPEGAAAGFNYRSLFSDVAVYSFGNLLIKGLSLISAPIFTRLFDPAQYGAWSYINVMVALMTGIMLLGGDSAYTRYFFQCENEEEKKTLTVTWFTFLAIWSVVALAAILPFSATLSAWMMGGEGYRTAWVIGLASAPLAMMNLILAQALRNTFRARAFALFNVATAVLTIGLAVFFVTVFEMGVAGAVLGAAAASLLIIPLRLWSVRGLLSPRFSLALVKKLLLFGLPLVPMNIAFWLFSNGDRLMLARLAGLEDVGLYSIAASMAAVLMVLQNAVGQSWQPHGIKVYEENRELAAAVFRRTMIYLLAGAGFVITGFTALAQEVLFLLVPPAYYAAYSVIPFLAAGFLFFTSAHVSVVAILVKNKTVYIMFACWLVAGLNLLLNRLLIPLFGMVGAGVATGLAYMLFAAGYAFISRKLWPVDYPRQVTTALLAIPLAAIALIAAVARFGPGILANFALKLAVLVLCGLLLATVVAKAEGKSFRELARELLKKKGLK